MKAPRLFAKAGLWAWLLLAGGWATGYASSASQLWIHFIDVGQGDAILVQVQTAAGSARWLNILIDGGPYYGEKNKDCRRVVPYLEAQGLPRCSLIDYMIITHPHTDHYGGLEEVLDQYEVRNIIDSGCPPEKEKEFGKFIGKAKQETVQGKLANYVELGSRPDFELDWGPVEARILHRYRPGVKYMGKSNPNRASTVIRIVHGRFSFLLMGDAEGKTDDGTADKPNFVEGELVNGPAKAFLPSTVLKVGHHGSETASTSPFLEAVKPEFVVIMSGRKKYHSQYLPAPTVVQRYAQVRPAPTILRTDEGEPRAKLDCCEEADGDDIQMNTDGQTLQVRKAVLVQARRQWEPVREVQ